MQPRAVSYEEQVGALREQLAALYEAREEWSKAAQSLAGIDLDSGMRVLDAGACAGGAAGRAACRWGGAPGAGKQACGGQAAAQRAGRALHIPSGSPSLPPAEYKLGKNVKIAMLYLEDEDAVSAETYIKKASSLLAACKVSCAGGRVGSRGAPRRWASQLAAAFRPSRAAAADRCPTRCPAPPLMCPFARGRP